MNIIDLLIIAVIVSSLVRGRKIGLIRQAGSTVGFIAGLFIGSRLGNVIISHVNGSLNRSLVSLLTVLLFSFTLMSLGEVGGIHLRQKLVNHKVFHWLDGSLGSAMAVITTLLAIWLAGSILILGSTNGLQQSLKNSRILATLNANLPPATQLLGSLNKLIDPNGFPEVFRGLEPNPSTHTTLPALGSFNAVMSNAQASVVKVEGTGCGGIVEGSGFVIAIGQIATNAHVVAGVATPKVLDAHGVHSTRVIWFDPDVDLAVLQVNGSLAGQPLAVSAALAPPNAPGVVLGYPGGGDFDAEPAAVIDHFSAYGRNIYGQGNTVRGIYSLQAKIIPGNSGGPLIGADGKVLGIVFATSTTYNNVGYALTGQQVANELHTAEQSTTTQTTGSCSE